jgi:thiamine-phosphate pyrophosphorylase
MSSPLGEARLYLVAPARVAAGPLVDLVPELVAAGVDIIQLREKEMEAGDLLRVGAPLVEACAAAGVPFIVNDRPDVALALGAPGVHLGTNDLPTSVGRAILGDGIVGRSTHSRDDIAAALASGPDYIAVGPVYETPTKPGRPAAGIDLISYAAGIVDVPWFAIGGIDISTIGGVLDAGAERVVVVRAITEADDPPAAATRLKQILVSAPTP